VAAENGHAEMAALLMQGGADVNARNKVSDSRLRLGVIFLFRDFLIVVILIKISDEVKIVNLINITVCFVGEGCLSVRKCVCACVLMSVYVSVFVCVRVIYGCV
jgi:hypothetical protein